MSAAISARTNVFLDKYNKGRFDARSFSFEFIYCGNDDANANS